MEITRVRVYYAREIFFVKLYLLCVRDSQKYTVAIFFIRTLDIKMYNM